MDILGSRHMGEGMTTETTKRGNGKRIIDGLKAAVAYAKGDKTKGKLTRITVKKS
jgi:hypothetical protein